jgi:hypothetical protein
VTVDVDGDQVLFRSEQPVQRGWSDAGLGHDLVDAGIS